MKRGVIILPMIFGTSLWTALMSRRLRQAGFLVEIADFYNEQPFPRPRFFKLIGKNEDANMARLAGSFQYPAVEREIKRAHTLLTEQGAEQVYLMGSSIGAAFAIQYATDHQADIAAVLAWYPTLIFPTIYTPEGQALKQGPDIEKLERPLQVFIGEKDSKLEAGTLALLQEAAKRHPKRIELTVYPGVNHGFLEATVQAAFPNPLYRPAFSRRSLDAAIAYIRQS